MTALDCIRAAEVLPWLEEDRRNAEAYGEKRVPGNLHQWAGFDTEEEWHDAIRAGEVCGLWVTPEYGEHVGLYNTGLTVCLARHGRRALTDVGHIGYARMPYGGPAGYQWMPQHAAVAPPIPAVGFDLRAPDGTTHAAAVDDDTVGLVLVKRGPDGHLAVAGIRGGSDLAPDDFAAILLDLALNTPTRQELPA